MSYKDLPLTYSWGIWLAINTDLFEGMATMPLKCATKRLNIVIDYTQFSSPPPHN